eukprot:CAMPEP_0116095924 /NCGR_PEP_ID=MMETSP0327-20121206/9920_1 /TAXON_ID=44447 /ORGANISM="Pseudo-nitzschia delicatissima, Strain B596" /LENGTH=123 /DNA_ID=CAMNT_0003587619 /DNA_START=58 /DNA_END=429 /DNA_ORIENTATION=-
MMSFRNTALVLLSTIAAATAFTCPSPLEPNPFTEADMCPSMNTACEFPISDCPAGQKMRCMCGSSNTPWVCQCRGDPYAPTTDNIVFTKENNATDVESMEISGGASASAISALVLGGMAAALL